MTLATSAPLHNQSQPRPFEGLLAATFTPMHADLGNTINTDLIEPYARFLERQGVRGVFACGTTGEYPSLTLDERMQVAAAWRVALGPAMQLVVHVAHNCLADAQQLARHAREIGADAIAAAPPSAFKPRGIHEIVTWSAEIAAAAPDVPFYYYHIPAMTGVPALMTELVPAARERIPSFAGLKFSHSDLADYAGALQAANGALDFFSGSDEMLLAFLAMGGRGAVGSTYNFMAPVLLQVMQAFDRGDLAAARDAQYLARKVCAIVDRYRPLPAQKCIMRWLGLDCGPARLPLFNLTAPEEAQFRAELDALGLFERIAELQVC